MNIRGMHRKNSFKNYIQMRKVSFRISNLIVLAVIAGFIAFVWRSVKHEPELTLKQIVIDNPKVILTGYVSQSEFKLPFATEGLAFNPLCSLSSWKQIYINNIQFLKFGFVHYKFSIYFWFWFVFQATVYCLHFWFCFGTIDFNILHFSMLIAWKKRK